MSFLRAAATFGVILLASGATAADIKSPLTPEAQQTTSESGWTFSVAPYFWVAGLSGDVGSFGLPVAHVDASFSDILDHLDFGVMAIGEARYGPYSLFGDVMYTKISGQAGTPRGVLATDVEVSSETFAGLLGAGYSIFEDSSARLDIVGGMRVWSVDNELSFSGGLLDGVSRSDDATWVDGLIGFRGTYSLTPEIYLTGWGLVGAGGEGGHDQLVHREREGQDAAGQHQRDGARHLRAPGNRARAAGGAAAPGASRHSRRRR